MVERAQKQETVESLNKTFAEGGAVVVSHYRGMTVNELTTLRRQMKDFGVSFKITKNTLAARALKGTPFEGVANLFKGPTAVAIGKDPVSAAKLVYDYAKKNEKLVVVGGMFDTTVLDKAGVEKLAKMPSLNELRAKLAALLVTPATRIATISQAPAAQIARVINAYAQK